MPTFEWISTIFTSKVGHTDLVFVLWSRL